MPAQKSGITLPDIPAAIQIQNFLPYKYHGKRQIIEF
jgi:hypothetical protein